MAEEPSAEEHGGAPDEEGDVPKIHCSRGTVSSVRFLSLDLLQVY